MRSAGVFTKQRALWLSNSAREKWGGQPFFMLAESPMWSLQHVNVAGDVRIPSPSSCFARNTLLLVTDYTQRPEAISRDFIGRERASGSSEMDFQRRAAGSIFAGKRANRPSGGEDGRESGDVEEPVGEEHELEAK